MNQSSDNPVREGETCVFSDFSLRKRDALLFDRVYVNRSYPTQDDVPEQISFGDAETDKRLRNEMSGMANGAAANNVPFEDWIEMSESIYQSETIRAYQAMGYTVVPSYIKPNLFLRDFASGQALAYEAALCNLPSVDVRNTSWEQILQFREDAKAIGSYRDFRLWAQSSCNSKSLTEAKDLVNQKLEDYKWAMKKHGIQTVTGTLSSIFEFKQSAFSIAASAFAGKMGGPVWAALTAGLVIGSQVAIKVTERRLTLSEVRRGPNREVAILHDAWQGFG